MASNASRKSRESFGPQAAAAIFIACPSQPRAISEFRIILLPYVVEAQLRKVRMMKKFLALMIFALVAQPARAGIFDLMIYGPPDRYGAAFAQCAAQPRTASAELECARQYVLRDPVPAVGAAEMTAFFARGRCRRGAARPHVQCRGTG
jgi:hypothetical protein